MAQVTGPYDIDAVRKEWIGKRTPVNLGRYPVEYEPIRRFCHMVEDTNPLFLDPHYADTTKYVSVIVPPVMTSAFSGPWGLAPGRRRGPAGAASWRVRTAGEQQRHIKHEEQPRRRAQCMNRDRMRNHQRESILWPTSLRNERDRQK